VRVAVGLGELVGVDVTVQVGEGVDVIAGAGVAVAVAMPPPLGPVLAKIEAGALAHA
jgi:hypothetical protein